VARSGTSAWLPKRPEEIPAPGAARFARVGGGREAGARQTSARATRPFRFGSEDQPDPDPALASGTLVGGRYRIAGLLGEGGMGRVYVAEHTVLQRRVALKLLRRDTEAAAENLARFQREALAASRIGTPQIVEIVDFDHYVGPSGERQTYMVMELLVGQSFEDWMEDERGLDEGLELLAQLCDGLAAAHRAGVIHRDIKPANVFCCAPDPTVPGAGPRVKILDFGIAKITAGGHGYQTQRGALLGTPYYLAPERVMGAKLSAAADIYSVGVILYELLTGTVPFVADSFMGILARHVQDQALDPRQAAPSRTIPDSVASLAMRLLAKQPEDRPSAAALAAELRELIARERTQLAAVRVGLASSVAGPGVDTQIFDDPSAAGIAERETVAPGTSSVTPPVSSSATVELGAPSVEGDPSATERGRSATAIGHASAAMSASTGAVELGGAAPVAAKGVARARFGLIGGAAAAALILVGVVVVAMNQGRGGEGPGAAVEPAPEPVEADGAGPGPIDDAATSAEVAVVGPAPPDDAETARDSPTLADGVVTEPPAAEEIPTQPEPSAPKPKPKPRKPQPEPKPKPKPDSEAQAGPAPEPPSESGPAPEPDPSSDSAPDPADSQLPTIKDDVYD